MKKERLKKIKAIERQLASLGEVEELRMSLSQTRVEMKNVKKAHLKLKKHYKKDRDHLKALDQKAEEVPKLATERLLASASVLDQISWSSRANLLACAQVEASLGLPVF